MDAGALVRVLGALAQETRLAALRTLVPAGDRGMPAGTLADTLGVPATTLSFHLAQLLNAGLVTQRRVGRQVIYSAECQLLQDLADTLNALCATYPPAPQT